MANQENIKNHSFNKISVERQREISRKGNEANKRRAAERRTLKEQQKASLKSFVEIMKDNKSGKLLAQNLEKILTNKMKKEAKTVEERELANQVGAFFVQWGKLLKSENDEVRLKAIKYLTDRSHGAIVKTQSIAVSSGVECLGELLGANSGANSAGVENKNDIDFNEDEDEDEDEDCAEF